MYIQLCGHTFRKNVMQLFNHKSNRLETYLLLDEVKYMKLEPAKTGIELE